MGSNQAMVQGSPGSGSSLDAMGKGMQRDMGRRDRTFQHESEEEKKKEG